MKNIDYGIIGQRIRDIRISKKWTQAHLAEISDHLPHRSDFQRHV